LQLGIWATASERAQSRPTTTSSSASSYGRVSQRISFVSGGIKTGSKIEQQKSKPEKKSKPILIESYDSDDDSDVQGDDDDDDDDDIEVIQKKRKRRGDFEDEDDDDDDDGSDSDAEEVADEPERTQGSVGEKNNSLILKLVNMIICFRVMKMPKNQLFNVNHLKFNINEHHKQIQHQSMTSKSLFTNLTNFNSFSRDFGTFEKHTRGIGMKLMAKVCCLSFS